jgi:hypothetical protein
MYRQGEYIPSKEELIENFADSINIFEASRDFGSKGGLVVHHCHNPSTFPILITLN